MPESRILYIEDNATNRKIVRDLFTAKGYKILEADTGEDGIEMARREVPDLILLDIQLPKMDGYAVARALKADPLVQHIPIIAVTSYALSGDDRKAMDAGCNGYIAKPFKPRELLRKAEEFLETRGVAHDAREGKDPGGG